MGSDKDSQNLIMASLDFLSNQWNKERASLELSIARDEEEGKKAKAERKINQSEAGEKQEHPGL